MRNLKRLVSALCTAAFVLAMLPAATFAFAEAPATATAYQISTNGRQIRLIAAVDSLDYKAIGFEITAEDDENGLSQTKKYSDNLVYSSIAASNGTFTSADFGIDNGYVYVLIINNLPKSATITATAIVTDLDDVEHRGQSQVINIEDTDDGVYPITGDNATARLDQIDIKDIDGDGVIRVACLGDSITGGNQGDNWPLYLGEYLNYLGTIDGNQYVVTNHGKGGAAVHHVEEQVGDPNWGWSTVNDADGDGKAYFYYDDSRFTSIWTYTPDVVLIQFGTNDANGNYQSYFKNDYYNYLIKPFYDNGAQIIMACPTYANNGWHNDSVNGHLHDYIVDMAAEWGFPVIDLNRFTWGLDEVFADGLHGNVSGYSMMAQLYYKYVFGGKLIGLTFNTETDADVRVTDNSNDRTYIRNTGAAGTATMGFIAGPEYDFTARVTKDGCAAVAINIATEESKSYDVALESLGQNFALNATVSDCGVAIYKDSDRGDHVSSNINDADKTGPGYQPSSWHEGDWCALDFTSSHSVNKLVLYWETASYISSYEDAGYNIYYKSAGEWMLLDSGIVTSARDMYDGDIVCDTLTLSSAVSAEGIKVEFLGGTIVDHKYAPQLYELEVY